MSESKAGRFFGTVAICLGLGAAFVVLNPFFKAPNPGNMSPPQTAFGPEAALLSERVQTLIDLLQERDGLDRPRSELDAPSPRATRDPIPVANESSDAELLEALERLEQVVREEAHNTRTLLAPDSGERAVLERIKDADRPADWAAWAPILALWRDDPEAARAVVKLLTDQEVLDRFGTPTDVWSVDQGITWQYARDKDPVDGSYGTEIILRVPKGYVTQLAVRGRDW